MKQQHERTLQALFSHPLHHDLRISEVEGLLLKLGIRVEHLSDHRLNLQAPSGAELVLHAASGLHHPFLNEDGVLRLRRFLKEVGVTPERPTADAPEPRGDQARRLVIHLDHRGARLWWLEGDEISASTLEPNDLWRSHQRLSHRHDRDIAGQRAPLDYGFMKELSQAVLQADRVLLLGHGHGESDLRRLLSEYLEQHHPGAAGRMEGETLDDTDCSEAELIAVARAHFGNLPHRSLPKTSRRDPGSRS
jgi:hypothetical protein